jgi:hypothetical protein
LRGASHPEELVQQAIALGYKEIAITIAIVWLVLCVLLVLQKIHRLESLRLVGLIY